MTEHNLEDKIKLLRQIKPDKEWKESTRAFLLSKMRGDERILADEADESRSLVGLIGRIGRISPIGRIGQISRLRPAMAAALVVIFTITGCAYGLNISKRSLPGDMFWNVKVSLEKAQVTFSSPEGKVKLETEFAGKRLEELKIVSLEEKPKAVAQAVENFKIHISEAKEGIRELENRGLKSASPGSPTEDGTPETYAAITAVEDEYGLWEEELIEKIETRIAEARFGTAKFDESEFGLEAEIDKAEEFLEEGRLVEALEKILEVERMMAN